MDDICYRHARREMRQNQVILIDVLIQAGAEVNSMRTSMMLNHKIRTEVGGCTLMPHVVSKGLAMLHVAAYDDYHKCIDVLVQAGVDVNETIRRGETPLIIATGKQYPKCVTALLSSGADPKLKSNGLQRYM